MSDSNRRNRKMKISVEKVIADCNMSVKKAELIGSRREGSGGEGRGGGEEGSWREERCEGGGGGREREESVVVRLF